MDTRFALATAIVLALIAHSTPADARDLVIRSISQAGQTRFTSTGALEASPEIVEERRPMAGSVRRGMCAWPMSCTSPQPTQWTASRLNLVAYATEIDSASVAWGVDSSLVRAVVHAESAFRPDAISPKGAQGLMQLMPATAQRFAVTDPFDPGQNIAGGVQYLAWLLARFDGDERLATAAYNAGEGAVDRYGTVPPFNETQAYVERVEQLAQAYRKEQKTLAMMKTGTSPSGGSQG